MKSNELFVDLNEAGQLFGCSAEDITTRIETGKFPVEPVGINGMFERGRIERAANDYWKSRGTDGLVWVHPTVFESADTAADEQRFYREVGAVIAQGKSGEFSIHVSASVRPANRLRFLKRMGANLGWRLREFTPERAKRKARAEATA